MRASDFLQFHNRLLLAILMVFFISFCSGLDLKISPPSEDIKVGANNLVCYNLTVFTDRSLLNINVKDYWAEEDYFGNDINSFVYSANSLGISLRYSEHNILIYNSTLPICITAKYSGNYKGIIFVEDSNGLAGLGSWLNLEVVDSKGITGFVVGELGEMGDLGVLEVFMTSIMVFLGFVLFILIKRAYK